MKKLVCLVAAVALLGIGGCAKKAPEEAAKKYVQEMIAKHEGFELDTSKLAYKVVEQSENAAKIEITGTIEVKGGMSLVKRGGEWVMEPAGKAAPKAPAVAAAAAKTAQEGAPKLVHEPMAPPVQQAATKAAPAAAAKAQPEAGHGEAQSAAHKAQ